MVFAKQPKFSDLTQQDRDDLWQRLAWCHSPARADLIMSGKDEETRIDRGKWRLLGFGTR